MPRAKGFGDCGFGLWSLGHALFGPGLWVLEPGSWIDVEKGWGLMFTVAFATFCGLIEIGESKFETGEV